VLFDSSNGTNVPVSQRRAGYVFQSLAIFPHMTVGQNVSYGLAHLPTAERKQRVAAILHAFRITPLARRSAREISGGESQRTALARTLVTNPELLLLDEPLAALDSPTKGQIIRDLREWNRTHRIPILYVTHSREEVFALGESVIVLEAGQIIAQGTPHEVMTAPTRETVAQLAGFENVFDAIVEEVSPERGTMTCRVMTCRVMTCRVMTCRVMKSPVPEDGESLLIETPLIRGGVGDALRIGIRAGDILLATSAPVGLSARNIIPGRVESLEQIDVMVSARVKCNVEMEVHLTLAARDALQLSPGKEVWLVIKTHSCHLMQR
jgi:molybdate transport system ATP-binding protein